MNRVRSITRLTVALAALAHAFGGAPAAAQDDLEPWQQQLLAQIEMMDERMQGAGFAATGAESGLVAGGESEDVTVQLDAGQYVAAAVCDNDCSDVDLAVSLRGSTLDSDVLEDDVPVVEFAVGSPDKHVFTVSMVSCSTSTCGYALRIYRSGGASTAASSGGASDALAPWQQQIVAQLTAIDERVTSEGFTAAEADFGLLEAGAGERVSMSLNAGQYIATAVCDNDCGDVDLILYDSRGDKIDEDLMTDATPVVQFKGGGQYQFEVRMVSCATATCGWGLRIYRQN